VRGPPGHGVARFESTLGHARDGPFVVVGHRLGVPVDVTRQVEDPSNGGVDHGRQFERSHPD